jgi:DNA-binding transcriptional LysR family regulator
MNVHQAVNTFSHYSPQEKSDFLLQLAHALTIIARDTYEVEGEGLTQPARLRRINEVQHRIASFLVALMRQDGQRYPDDVLVRLILEHADDLELQRQLQEAVSHLMAQMAIPT